VRGRPLVPRGEKERKKSKEMDGKGGPRDRVTAQGEKTVSKPARNRRGRNTPPTLKKKNGMKKEIPFVVSTAVQGG